MNEIDISREGITLRKIKQLFLLLLPKNTKTLFVLDEFTDLSLDKLKKFKIKGIILDVDGCIAYNHQSILLKNKLHIDKLIKSGLKIVIYSNAKKTSRYDDLPKSVHVLTNIPPKPEKKGFEVALKKLGVNKKNIAMVGDNFITDGGAIQYGINFVRVKALKFKHENIFEVIHRYICSFFVFVSKIHNLLRNK